MQKLAFFVLLVLSRILQAILPVFLAQMVLHVVTQLIHVILGISSVQAIVCCVLLVHTKVHPGTQLVAPLVLRALSAQ